MRTQTLKSLCADIQSKLTVDVEDDEAKLKRLLGQLLRCKIPLDKLGLPDELLEIIYKHNGGRPCESGATEELVERGPQRSPQHLHSSPPYTVRSYFHNGVQRVQETDNCAEIAAELCANRNFYIDVLEKTLHSVNETSLIANGLYRNQLNEKWMSARVQVQNSGQRSARNSFSSVASPASSASSFPQSPSSPGSCKSLAIVPEDVNATHGSVAYANLPAPLAELHMSTSPDSSDVNSPISLPAPETEPTAMKELLAAKLDPQQTENAWVTINKHPIDKLITPDSEGDTQLMILLANKAFQSKEYLYYLVERLLKESADSLSLRSKEGQDALHHAIANCRDQPLLAAYIAEAYVRGNQPFKPYDKNETALHYLAARGDVYEPVLRELLKVTLPDSSPAFNINDQNSQGQTALHIACEVHNPNGLRNRKIVRALLEAGADASIQERRERNTPLHVLVDNSADIDLLSMIGGYLDKTSQLEVAAATTNRQNNNILHLACSRNGLPLEHHKKLVVLINSFDKTLKNLKNCKANYPANLVAQNRKEVMKEVLKTADACKFYEN